jgi:hypothetical protein
MNTLNKNNTKNNPILSDNQNPSADLLSDQFSVDYYTELWMRAFKVTMKNQQSMMLRLRELKAGEGYEKPNERQGKIKALEALIKTRAIR